VKILYAQVTDSAHAYVAAEAARSGLSMAKVTSMILDEASVRGWHISTGWRIKITGSGSQSPDADTSPAARFRPPLPPPRDQGQPPAEPPLGKGAGPTSGGGK
jgi:hypothetical protein